MVGTCARVNAWRPARGVTKNGRTGAHKKCYPHGNHSRLPVVLAAHRKAVNYPM